MIYNILKEDYHMSDNDEKQIKVVSGNGKDLNISTVYEHIKKDVEINETNENNSKKKKIIIPKGSSDSNDQ